MFAILYSFKIKANKKQSFVKAWSEMTLLIRQYEGGLGSRLHQKSDREFIAYAQWPDKATWENSGAKLPKSAEGIRKEMRESCEEIKALHELDLVEDLLLKI